MQYVLMSIALWLAFIFGLRAVWHFQNNRDPLNAIKLPNLLNAIKAREDRAKLEDKLNRLG